MKNSRFNFEANTIGGVKEYFYARAKQLLRLNFKLIHIEALHEGVVSALFERSGKTYQSLYILKDYRGKGLYRKYVFHTILTSEECNIKKYLIKNSINFICVSLYPYKEYEIISDYYGNSKTSRSGVYMMNHIDEGLAILETISATEEAKKAYCLHPILQADKDFNNNYKMDFEGVSSSSLILAVEYRRVANSYLSNMQMSNFVGFTNKDVKDMLYADKVQNEKDFSLYHENNHPRTEELRIYFDNWLDSLLKTTK